MFSFVKTKNENVLL